MALVDLLLQKADADQLPDHLGGAGGRDPQQLPDLLPGEDGVDLPGLVDPLVFPAEVGAVVEQGVQHLCVAGKPAQERLLEQEGEELKILALDGAFGCGALGLGHNYTSFSFRCTLKKGTLNKACGSPLFRKKGDPQQTDRSMYDVRIAKTGILPLIWLYFPQKRVHLIKPPEFFSF